MPPNNSGLPDSPFSTPFQGSGGRGSGGGGLRAVSRSHPLKHYSWGAQCDGWNLADNPELSVKMERMPPHTAEQEHFHQFACQFFFILKGKAVFYTEEGRLEINPQEGLEIRPGLRHRIENEGEEDLEFILCSQPSTSADRYPTAPTSAP